MKADPDVQREIKRIVSILLKKYHNRDPFYLARLLGIKVTFLDFNEDIPAFSERRSLSDRGNIYINQNFGSYSQKILCAHELGHLLLHGVCESTFFDSDIEPLKEYEANYFTAILLPQIINKKEVLDYSAEDLNEYITSLVYYATRFARLRNAKREQEVMRLRIKRLHRKKNFTAYLDNQEKQIQ